MRASRPRPVFVVPFVFLLGIFAARMPGTIAQLVGMGGDFFAPISEVQRMLADSYVNEPDMTKLQTGAINGMMEALDDPYAQYIPPVEKAEFEKEMLGRFCGIGAQVQIDGGYPTVVTPMEDSPAYRAGILAGDKIIEVDGQGTSGLDIDQVVSKLTGEAGTKVVLKVRRAEKVLDFSLVRAEIVMRAVRGVTRGADGAWDYMLDRAQGIGYVRLEQFIPSAAEELAGALRSMDAEGGALRGLILDLRNNPGGDLVACLDIADLFLREGTIVSVRGRAGGSESYAANAAGTLPEIPLCVLVNGYSASASEIVSGALKDHERAVIVGTRTYGKGLVQTVRPLSSLRGAQVKYTIQRYELPSGRVIQRNDDSTEWGVDPTPGFYVPTTDEEELASQIKRRDLDVLHSAADTPADAPVTHWDDAHWIESEMKDRQLAAALRAVGTKIASGKWNPMGDTAAQGTAMRTDELRRLEKSHQRMLRALAQVEDRMDALETSVAGSSRAPRLQDLWADSIDVRDGSIEVFDKSGKKVADLRITGPELERWLQLADVTPAPEPPKETPAGEPQR